MVNNKVSISKLKYLAIKNNESVRTDEDIRQDDISDLVDQEIEDKIHNKELVNIQIIGQVTSGKSTLAIHYLLKVAKLLKFTPTINNIQGDQSEYLRKVRDPAIGNTCLMIDEWNQLGETGFNATTESALLTYYSDVQAQRYIHRISCAPRELVDPNADIVLEVLTTDRFKQSTTFLVYYRLVKASEERLQLCGRATVSVSDAIKCDFHQAYRKKKFAKMDFIIQHGIRDVRELEYARIILAAYIDLKPLVVAMNVKNDLAASTIEKIRRENKEFFSILTSEDVIRKVVGLLSLDRTMYLLGQKIKKMKQTGQPVAEEQKAFAQLSQTRLDLLENYKKLVLLGKKYADKPENEAK